jgi:uncharacterized protein YjgD (DUF1641 family)
MKIIRRSRALIHHAQELETLCIANSKKGLNRNMAQPIPLEVPPRDPRQELRAKLERAPEEHAEAILDAYELIQELHDRGVLDLLRGMLGARDQLMDTVTAAIDTPEAIRAIRNFILLTKFFGSIHPDVLSSLVRTVMENADREKAHRAPGLMQLLRRLHSEDSRHGLVVALDLLEAVGRGL